MKAFSTSSANWRSLGEESEDCEENYLKNLIKRKEEGLKYVTDPYTFYPINIDMEIFKITGKLKEKKKNMENTTPPLEPVLGKTTIDIMEKVDLLDKGKFDEWIKGIKEAMSVIHKIDKSDEDILNASTKLQEILTSEQSLTFLRMLDSGLFTAVAEKIKKAKEDKFDDIIEKAEKVTENKVYKEPSNSLTEFGNKEYNVQELYPSAQLHNIRELVPAAGVHSDYLPVN